LSATRWFYDCSDEPIIAKYGWVEPEGETDGPVPWNSEEELWSCDEVPRNIDGPGGVRF
jgi:hypothetical protein